MTSIDFRYNTMLYYNNNCQSAISTNTFPNIQADWLLFVLWLLIMLIANGVQQYPHMNICWLRLK